MSADWTRIEELFLAGLEIPQDMRDAYVEGECGGDNELKREVLSLLDADQESRSLVEKVSKAQHRMLEDMEQGRVSTRVGPYELLEILGHGGMGTVYLAARVDNEYEAKVAMKFLRAGPSLPDVARRLRSERQILANLDHPNIARLLDGGATADGSPYLVMEYVDGVPVDQFCEDNNLGMRECLELFRTVCAAVQHAHQGLVVHRDLKPANILVATDGRPKLLDFGIAKLLDDGRDGEGDWTVTTQLMTPTFASPEQILGEAISVATDVYSLGAVLYLLLTGRPPFEAKGMSQTVLTQRICTQDVTRPSTAVASGSGWPPLLGNGRSGWAKRLQGDLDTIVTTALAKDPRVRYESVAALAEDVRRYLHGEAILARPQTLGYRFGKFSRRHPAGMVAGLAFALLVTGFSVYTTVQNGQLSRERDRAEQGEEAAQKVSEFLVGLFEVSDPSVVSADSVSAREILNRGADRIGRELGSQPRVRAELLTVLGRVYRNLGLYDEATELIDTAFALTRELYPEDDPRVTTIMWEKAEHLYVLGAYEESAALHRESLALQRQTDPDSPGVVRSLVSLGVVLGARGLLEESGEVYRESLGVEGDGSAAALRNRASALIAYGDFLRGSGELDSAVVVIQEGVLLQREELGDNHIELGHALNHLSRTYSLMGRNEEALPIAREGLAIRLAVFGDNHPEVGSSLGNLSGILLALGRLREAEEARRASLALFRAIYGDSHEYVAATLGSLAGIQLTMQDYGTSEANYRASMELLRGLLPEGHPNLGYSLTGLGRALSGLARPADAEEYLREAVAIRGEALPEGHWLTAQSQTYLAETLLMQDRDVEALRLLEGAYEDFTAAFGEEDPRSEIVLTFLNQAREAVSGS